MIVLFRTLGYLEGISLLVLLGIAMPLKYALGLATAVKIVGWIHGLLFMAYVVVMAAVSTDRKWKVQRTATAFFAAVVPFGTFLFDRSLVRELAGEARASHVVETRS